MLMGIPMCTLSSFSTGNGTSVAPTSSISRDAIQISSPLETERQRSYISRRTILKEIPFTNQESRQTSPTRKTHGELPSTPQQPSKSIASSQKHIPGSTFSITTRSSTLPTKKQRLWKITTRTLTTPSSSPKQFPII